MRLTFVQETLKNLKGIYLFAAQKDKCQEKVWKRVMGFGEEGKNLSSKRFFPLPQVQLLPFIARK
jgi:hypothetical protein